VAETDFCPRFDLRTALGTEGAQRTSLSDAADSSRRASRRQGSPDEHFRFGRRERRRPDPAIPPVPLGYA
jgi:hypothetical protein